MKFTRKGYVSLFHGDEFISQHTLPEEAYENAYEHAVTVGGDGIYTVKYPDREIDLSSLTRVRIPFFWNSTPTFSFYVGTPATVSLSSFVSNPTKAILSYSIRSGTLPSGVTHAAGVVTYDGVGAANTKSIQFEITDGTRTATASAANVVIFPLPDTTAPTWPSSPIISVTGYTSTSISLSWIAATDNVAVTGYVLERSTNNSTWTVLQNSTSRSFTDNGRVEGQLTYYRVRAYDAQMNYSSYGSVSYQIDVTAPSTPTLSAAAIGSSVSLSCTEATDNVGVVSYKFEYSANGSTNWSTLQNTAARTYSHTGRNPLTQYFYRVSALDAAGNQSVVSTASATTTTSGGQPDNGANFESFPLGAWPAQTIYVNEYGYNVRSSASPDSFPVVSASDSSEGSRSLRCQLTGSEASTNPNNYRSGIEFLQAFAGMRQPNWEGLECWGAVSLKLDADYPHPTDPDWPAAGIGYPGVGFDLHTVDSGETWSGAPLTLRASNPPYPGEWSVANEQNNTIFALGSYADDRGNWVRWTYNIVYSSTNAGRIMVWKDGVLVIDQSNILTLKSGNATSPYLKCQLYNGWQTTRYQPKTLGYYADDIRWAVGADKYSVVTSDTEYVGVFVSDFEGLTVGELAYVEDSTNWTDLSPGYSHVYIAGGTSPAPRSGTRKIDATLDRYNTYPDDTKKERTEIRFKGHGSGNFQGGVDLLQNGFQYYKATVDTWYGFSFYLPSTWLPKYKANESSPPFTPDLSNNDLTIISQIHRTADNSQGTLYAQDQVGSGYTNNPPGTIKIGGRSDRTNPYIRFGFHYGAGQTPTTLQTSSYAEYSAARDIPKGEWIDVVCQLRYDADAGYFRSWIKDSTTGGSFVQVANKTGGVGYKDYTHSYLKFGIYAPLWDWETYPNRYTCYADGSEASVEPIFYDSFRYYIGDLSETDGITYVRPR